MSNRVVALAGAPNVGKSTVFNELTGMHRHTGNWIGKTVDTMAGEYYYKYNDYTVVDLPGTYSLDASSEEERIAEEYIRSSNADVVVCVIDATLVERSLPLLFQIMSITPNVVLMLNLYDEAKRMGVTVDADALSSILGLPVVIATARSGKGINNLLEQVHLIATGAIHNEYESDNTLPYVRAKAIASQVVSKTSPRAETKLDKFFMSKATSFVSMLIVFGIVLWITISASNYPSELLKNLFNSFEHWLADSMLAVGFSSTIVSMLVYGVIRVLLWVVSVMLPPMAIFFPLFAVMEEAGILPRIAFNLDGGFEKCGSCGKQALTCCMGLGCNAVGVTGARIIDSPRERLIAIVTNSLVPCNGRFPFLIAVISMFFADSTISATLILLSFLCLSLAMTMLSSFFLSKTVLKGEASSFLMEIPPFRRFNLFKTVAVSVKEKVLFVLARAVVVSAPAGLVIWLLSNASVGDASILSHLAEFLNPFGKLIGMDGVMLLAFILGFPASEIVLPIALMCYLSTGELGDYSSLESLRAILVDNGWSVSTAICACVFSLFHFPCSTTLISIYKETKSLKWSALSVALPLCIGVILCLVINALFV